MSHMNMPVAKVYGSLDDTGTLRVIASLEEYKFEYELIPVDIEAGENETEFFLAMSPFGDIPVLVNAGESMFDSRSIMRAVTHTYLDRETVLVFSEAKIQGQVVIWVDVEDHHFDPPAAKLIEELVRKPKRGIKPDEAVVAEEEAKLAEVLDIYEEKLGKTKYLGWHNFTIADLTHLPNLYFLKGTQVKKLWESRPRVNAWITDIMALPAWKKVEKLLQKSLV